jgi:hypothetical protein
MKIEGAPLTAAVGEDSSSPATDRLARMEAELATLARGVELLVAKPAEEPPRLSLPVRAAVGGWKLSKNGVAILGVLSLLAELVSAHNGPFRAIWLALFERSEISAPNQLPPP